MKHSLNSKIIRNIQVPIYIYIIVYIKHIV